MGPGSEFRGGNCRENRVAVYQLRLRIRWRGYVKHALQRRGATVVGGVSKRKMTSLGRARFSLLRAVRSMKLESVFKASISVFCFFSRVSCCSRSEEHTSELQSLR